MKIAIVGAGLSGLACAFRLEQQGFQGTLDIFEKKPKVGEANVFLEFISELFHRPIGDFFTHLRTEFGLQLQPLHTIHSSQTFGPTEQADYEGFLGYVIARGGHEQSLERQLARLIKTPIQCGHQVDPNAIANEYDYIVIATGRLQDVPKEVGARVDRYIHFYHGIIEGSFNPSQTKMWFNNRYAYKGYGFQLTLSENLAMVALATPDQDYDLASAWKRFLQEVFGDHSKLQEAHEIRNFAIGQPNSYTFENQIFVGNVAGGVQPAMGFGLHTAILSGIYAADSIIKKDDYKSRMSFHTREYNWSLALRNVIEQMNDREYDLLVDGIDSPIGRYILRKGGYNVNRVAGRLLSMLTNETRNSTYSSEMKTYAGWALPVDTVTFEGKDTSPDVH